MGETKVLDDEVVTMTKSRKDLPKIPFGELSQQIAAADIVLGIFGDTPQSKKAMANK